MRLSDRLAEQFSPDAIADFVFDKMLPDLIVAASVMLAFWLVWRLLHAAARAVMKRGNVDATAENFVLTVLKYGLGAVAAIAALGQLGINLASLVASLGIAGLTIGFAAQDTLSNVIAGLFIFWDRPFVLGDLVEIDGHYGRVEEITMRSTRIVTPDGKMLAIPNTTIVNQTVTSYTNFPNLRLDIPVTVGVGENLGRVRELLLGTIAGDERFMSDPAPTVVAVALNDYNVKLHLRAWIHDEKQHLPMRFWLRERVFETLTEARVDMPFETLQIVGTPTPAAA